MQAPPEPMFLSNFLPMMQKLTLETCELGTFLPLLVMHEFSIEMQSCAS
jgi:hypothetical protein